MGGSSSIRPPGREKRNHQIHGIKSLAHLPIKYVHRFRDRHGKIRHYFRRPGRKRVPLPGLPGSAEFMAAYAAALTGETAPRIDVGASRTKPGSVAAAVASYLSSAAFGNLATGTKLGMRRILEHFREAHGEKSFADTVFQRRHVEAILALKAGTPHAARNFLRALRAVIGVAITAGLRDGDPTLGVRNVKLRATGGFHTWTEDEIAQFEAAHPIGTRARLAFALLLYTAQRRGDVVRMGRQHVRDGYIRVHQQKTGVVLEIPLHANLLEILSAHRTQHLTFLTTRAGEPFTPAGFSNWFVIVCRKAGLPGLSPHGLRKAMCRRLAEAGCSPNEISAISGHVTLREVERYTRAADQKRMAAAAMASVAKNKQGENKTIGKPDERVAKFRRNQLKVKE
jgi:integrase